MTQKEIETISEVAQMLLEIAKIQGSPGLNNKFTRLATQCLEILKNEKARLEAK